MRMVPLLMALVLVAGLAFVVFGARGASPSGPVARPEVEPEARARDGEVLRRVKRLAWDSREIDGPLADELIRYLNARENDLDLRAVRNEVAEIAWRHRTTCPTLSELVRHTLQG